MTNYRYCVTVSAYPLSPFPRGQPPASFEYLKMAASPFPRG